jgi:pyruvate dehydrogenase (quinone)
MLMGDLLTIAERQLPLKMVVFNNSHLGFVRIEQMEAGIAPFGTEFKNPNFAEVAETLGINGFRVAQAAEVRSTVEQFLGTPGPALLDAIVDPNSLALPPHATIGQAENFSLSLAKQAIEGNLDDVIATIKDNALLV